MCSAGIGRTRKCLQGEHFVRCCHSIHSLFFRVFSGVVGGSAAVCDPNPPRLSLGTDSYNFLQEIVSFCRKICFCRHMHFSAVKCMVFQAVLKGQESQRVWMKIGALEPSLVTSSSCIPVFRDWKKGSLESGLSKRLISQRCCRFSRAQM